MNTTLTEEGKGRLWLFRRAAAGDMGVQVEYEDYIIADSVPSRSRDAAT